MNIEINHDLVKQQVSILREFLNKEITQSSGYTAIAKIYGFKNWNHFKSFLDKSKEESNEFLA